MPKITIPLSEILQSQLMELCNLKGVAYLSFIGDANGLLIGAIGTEFLKFVDAHLQCDTDRPIAIRVPAKIIKTIATIGYIDLIIGDNLIVQKRHTYDDVVARIKLPLELDFSGDMLEEMNFAAHQCATPPINMNEILALKELVKVGMTGVQVKDGRAFISGNGYYVYKPFSSAYAFVMSNDCLSMMTSFITKSGAVQIFTQGAWILTKKDAMCFGWKKTRSFVSDVWDVFQKEQPLFDVGCDLLPVKSIIRGIGIEKTSKYTCILDFQTSQVIINAGTTGTYELKFTTPSTKVNYAVSVPFDIFKMVVSAGAADLQHLHFVGYKNFLCMNWDETQVLMVGDISVIK